MKEFIEKLIERLEEEKKQAQCEGSLSFAMGFKVAIKIVKKLAEEHNNGWIPCSERLPQLYENTSDVVLVCGNNDYQHMAFWCSDGKWRYCQSGMIKEPMDWIEIVAWQPLPEPYKEGGEVNE